MSRCSLHIVFGQSTQAVDLSVEELMAHDEELKAWEDEWRQIRERSSTRSLPRSSNYSPHLTRSSSITQRRSINTANYATLRS